MRSMNEPGNVWQWLTKLINLSVCFWFNFASCTSSTKSKSSLDENGSHGSSSSRIVGSGWLFKVSLNSSALATRVRLPLWGWYLMAMSPSCGACVLEPISVPVSRSIRCAHIVPCLPPASDPPDPATAASGSPAISSIWPQLPSVTSWLTMILKSR